MIIKKIVLQNIRSYKDAEIEFPLGSTLLMGDIGCGKTSVLLAIEFALFGLQPSQKGSSLLRNTETEGKVTLEFEIDDQNVIIERKLKKGSKGVTQGEGMICINNDKFEGSVTEIKNRVLKLLNYPPEFAKKTNDLYKFTVYTPQEEMKQIIQESNSTRLNTLRHIFGIDKYKRISENLEKLTVKLRQEIRVLEVQLKDIEIIKKDIEEKQLNLEGRKKRINELEQEISKIKEKRLVKENEIKELESKIDQKRQLENEISKLELMLRNKQENTQNYLREIQNLSREIEEGSKFSYDSEKVQALKNQIAKQEDFSNKIDEEYLLVASAIQSQESRKKELENLKIKIQGLDKCPTCLQNVDELYKRNILEKANNELEIIQEQFQIEQSKKQELIKKDEQIKKQIRSYKDSLSEMEILKIKLQPLEDKKKKVKEIEQQVISSNKDILMIKDQITSLMKTIKEYEGYSLLFEQKNKEFQEVINNQQSLEISKAETNKDIQFLEQQIKDKQEEIKKIESLFLKINSIKELESWLSNKFVQLVLFTEKNVMLKLREEFSQLFSTWFSVLVSDTLKVRLDETFTPIVEQQDYEIDYGFLSGGERTAVALAYRLALNQVINSMLSKIKTHDIVILDEPTDGFSSSQLDKIRDVLYELNVKQLILVSHEQKIEGFVDNIIRFKKIDGITIVEK